MNFVLMGKWVCREGAKEVILGLGFGKRESFVRLKVEKRRTCGGGEI